MSHIFGHVAYEGSIWSIVNPPACLQGDEASPRSIIIAHNKVCGELLAGLERDMALAAQLQDLLEREVRERRRAVEVKDAKIRQLSETVRRQAEELKRLRS